MKEVDFAILDKTFAAIKSVSLVQRMILGMTARFKEGNRFNNKALGEFFQDTPGTISHLINDLKKKKSEADDQAFVVVFKSQSPGRVFFLNPKHPALIEIAEYHKAERWCKDEKACCLHCYFQQIESILLCCFQPTENNSLSGKQPTEKSSLGGKSPTTLLKTTNSYKGVKDITTKEGKKPVGANKVLQKIITQNPQESFETFWQAYPKKVARKAALKLWLKLSPANELTGKIMLALEKHKAQDSWQKDSGKYIPKPSNWLNDELWTDVLTDTQAEPDYSGALNKYTREISEQEATKLMKEV